jgi:2-polyprenyl-6-hydroxyphenyl methylase/3-demethylubiquinone-9 3-methyltransferase
MNEVLLKEIDPRERFAFGKNWSSFIRHLTPERINSARESMEDLLDVKELTGLSFLDAGSGSGLFSLVANQLGAKVTSFDYDTDSVHCTEFVMGKYAGETPEYKVLQGSLLNAEFMKNLGEFDVVYCWGVAHHTGDMWKALGHLTGCVRAGGKIVIAIYNDQEYLSRRWIKIKQLYQKLPSWLQPLYVICIFSMQFLNRVWITLLVIFLRVITLKNPLVPIVNWIKESRDNSRGMHAWYDLVDWVGGWPYQVAKPEEIFRFFRDQGYVMVELTTCQGHGCNEYVFRKTDLNLADKN